MNVLLTFAGFHDPYSMGLVGEEEQSGPILSLVAEKPFDQIFLFSTPDTAKNASDTAEALHSLYGNLEVNVRELYLDDPTDYISILKGLRTHFHQICEEIRKAEFFISVASGTPQMHACWLLLAASGEIPAHILHVRPRRFVSKDRPLVSTVDLTFPGIPIVRANSCIPDVPDIPIPDLETALRQLGIIGDHPTMRKALETGAMLAPANSPILVLGETGTGKELFAKFIHHLSGRPRERFVPLNCAAIPSELVESLLFGHKRGAFTGAITDQMGKFDQADGGTLFLDELAELSMQTQAKLLRVLQDNLIEPLGAKGPHYVNVRIIAATNRDLGELIQQKCFREDLYYRLSVGEVRLPSLRERRSDIPKIALHLLDRVNSGLRRQRRFSPDTLVRLQNHPWPGNIRDMENAIERSVLLSRRDILEPDDLVFPLSIDSKAPLVTLPEPYEGFSLARYLDDARKQLVLRALELSDGNQSEAARLLGVSPQAVHKFLKTLENSSNQS